VLKRLSLLLATLVVALAAAELVLRLFFPQWTVARVQSGSIPMYRAHPQLLAETTPNFRGSLSEREFDVAVELNSMGYRQREIEPEKRGQTRVLVIGDSFTFGHGVEGEQAYPRQLERLLSEGSGREVEVINAGIPGRWVDQYYLELKLKGVALDPDLVLVGLYIKNDLDGQDARAHVWTEVDEAGMPVVIEVPGVAAVAGFIARTERKARWRLPIIRDSHVAQLFFDAARAIGAVFKTYRPKAAEIYQPVYEAGTEQAIGRVRDLLVAMATLSRESGARFAVVLLPSREQVYPDRYPAPDGLDYEKPQRLLSEMLEREGIESVDLLPAMRRARDDSELYFRRDTHWTAAGHSVAAGEISRHLAQKRLSDAGAAPGEGS